MRSLPLAALTVALLAGCTMANEPDPGTQLMLKACQLDTRGIRLEHGRVVDVIHTQCDPRPVKHTLEAWLEVKPDDGGPVVRSAYSTDFVRPDAVGYDLRVEFPRCVTGEWHAYWAAYGTGPTGLPFSYKDGDWGFTHIDCAAGG